MCSLNVNVLYNSDFSPKGKEHLKSLLIQDNDIIVRLGKGAFRLTRHN